MKFGDKLTGIFRILPAQQVALKRLGIVSAKDLLYHFPARYGDSAQVENIGGLSKGSTAVVFGKIFGLKTSKAFRKKIPIAEGFVEDDTGKIKIVWFHQAYLAKMLVEGSNVRVEGKVSEKRDGTLYFSNPKIENAPDLFTQNKTHSLYPIYPETRGITSNWIYHKIQNLFNSKILEEIIDPIPENILKTYKLPNVKTSLIYIHTPQKVEHAEVARKRFAFEEIFFIQLERQKTRHEFKEQNAFVIEKEGEEIEKFVKRFPFSVTSAQRKSIEQIFADFKKGHPMSRLLEGDVGSGKTAVAATAVYAVATSHPVGSSHGSLQSAYMAPTEILAQQHFESFIKYFKHLPINIALITGSGCRKFPSKINPDGWTNISRAQLLKWVVSGEIAVLIGTHALIEKSVKFKHLALVIIDEQHRFGVKQRAALLRGTIAEQTQKDAEKLLHESASSLYESTLIYKDLSYTIRGILFDIKKNLGLGHKEQIYQRAFEEELTERKIAFSREKQIPIIYNKKKIGVYQPDFVIDEKIIVEFKALPFVGTRETKQLWTYLKGSDYKLALLVNFGSDLEIKRVIYDQARTSAYSPRNSASIPHLLSMTATPIPRTLALTLYGDLDLSLLDEMPAGRKRIITEIISPERRGGAYGKIREEIKDGRQLYVICPRIAPQNDAEQTQNSAEEIQRSSAYSQRSSAYEAKSVKEESKRLKKEVFPEYEIGILHSKMKPAEKEKIMLDFQDKKIDILVATSVVEVGVNIENASLVVIEGAERFGLAQLHQLRGRVIRSDHQAYCFIFTESQSEKARERLKALVTAKNGFELAEFDLTQRGAGELTGAKQWGISDIGMEAIKNIKMVEAARTEATKLIESDPTLSKFPLLKSHLDTRASKIHFE